MAIPKRNYFTREYASRALKLIEGMEGVALSEDVVGTFSVLTGSSLFSVSLDHMNGTPFIAADERLTKKYNDNQNSSWDQVIDVDLSNWKKVECRDAEEVKSNLDQGIQQSVFSEFNSNFGSLLRVIRNAISHGSIFYVDDKYKCSEGDELKHICFVSERRTSRYFCEACMEISYTKKCAKCKKMYNYRLTDKDGYIAIYVEYGEFLKFIKSWCVFLTEEDICF